eukprot:g27966.t1
MSWRLHGRAKSSLDLFFVLANAWSAGAVLVVQLPEAFSLTSDCEVWPLTPWLRWDEVACTSSNASLAVNFTAPLPSGAALALRIAPLFLTDFAPKESLNLRLESRPVAVQQQFGGALLDARDACHPKVWSCGLYPVWAAELVWRPSLYRLDFFEARLSNLERRRSTWVHLRFAVNTTLAFQGNPEDRGRRGGYPENQPTLWFLDPGCSFVLAAGTAKKGAERPIESTRGRGPPDGH